MGGGGSKYQGPDVLGTRKLNENFKKMAEDAKAKAKKVGGVKKIKKVGKVKKFGGAVKMKPKPKKK
tara:strand:+ start:72 stop:269 length:198 start_codon:yes stop_codon:yes gene_type:complete